VNRASVVSGIISNLSEPGPTDRDEGVDPSVAEPLATMRETPSLRPALFVLACVAVVSFGGFALALAGSSPAASPGPLGSSVPGSALKAVPAAQALERITSPGLPPPDVVGALVVPAGATVTGSAVNDAGFDRTVTLAVDATTAEVNAFYEVELSRARWSKLGTYSEASGGHEILAKLASSDGYEWELGVVTASVTPAISPALAGGSQSSATTRLSLRLFQVPDGS